MVEFLFGYVKIITDVKCPVGDPRGIYI